MQVSWLLSVVTLFLLSGLTPQAFSQPQNQASAPAAFHQTATDSYLPGVRQRPQLLPTPADSPQAAPSSAHTGVEPSVTAPAPNFGGFYAAPFVNAGGGNNDTIATVTGDFNHDGKPDVLNISIQGAISVLLNDGNGGFASPIASQIAISPNSNYLIDSALASDLNGDGYTDLVLGLQPLSNSDHVLLVVLNRKDGTFGPPTSLYLPGLSSGNGFLDSDSFTVGQTTASGHTDIVVAERYTSALQVQTFLNDGTGKFSQPPPQTVTIPANEEQSVYASTTPLLSDVNHDGHLDLLLERYAPITADYVDLLIGNGDGTFQQPVAGATVVFPGTEGISSGEFFLTQSLTANAAKSDLILSNSGGVYVSLSNGDGTFQAPTHLAQIGGVSQLFLADLNGDGKPDLITSGAGALVTFLGNGDGSFGSIAGTAVAGDPSPSNRNTSIADFNGDGKVDFVSGDINGNVELALGKGDGAFTATPLLYSPASPTLAPYQFLAEATGDLNGDGLPDLIGYGPGSFFSALANGKGGFTYQSALPFTAYPVGLIEPATADFNGDGKQDVIFSGYDHTAGVAISNGDGTFKTPVTVIKPPAALACNLSLSAAGDINGDGKLDVIFAYPGDAACRGGATVPAGYLTALGNGDGTFKDATFTPVGNALYSVALAKFHGKNQPLDLVINDTDLPAKNASVSILQGKGDGTFGTPVTVNSGYRINQMLTDDFNQDGIADLTLIAGAFVRGTSDGALLYAGNGDGTFQTPTTVGGTAIDIAAVYADVNGDGIPDLIGNGTHGLLSVNLGTGKGVFANPVTYFYDNNNSPLFAGRFLGDNTQSLVSPGQFSGGTAFFMNRGGTALTLTPSATGIVSGQTLTLSSTLIPTLTGQPAPTSTITFYDGSTQIGVGSVGSPVNVTQLPVGTHSITAAYAGDAHFNPNTSIPVTVIVSPLPPDFVFAATAASLNIAKGQSGTINLTLAANANLASTFNFQCTGLPAETTCAFSPVALNVAAGSSGQTALTITTKAASATPSLRAGHASRLSGLSMITLAGLVFLIHPGRRRKGLPLVLILILASGSLVTLSGCGSGTRTTTPAAPIDPGTPLGTANIIVTATPASGTTLTHTVTIALTVQ